MSVDVDERLEAGVSRAHELILTQIVGKDVPAATLAVARGVHGPVTYGAWGTAR